MTWRWCDESFSMAAFTTRALSEARMSALHVGVKRRMVGLFEFHGVAVASAGGAEVIDGAVARDGEQPRGRRRPLRIEGLHAVPDAEKSFLHQVFGDAGVAHHAKNERVGDAAVAVVELREGLRFAALEANDESRRRFGAAKRHQMGRETF